MKCNHAVEQLVAEYLEKHGVGYPSDISNALGLSLKTTVEALKNLEEKGVVKPKN